MHQLIAKAVDIFRRSPGLEESEIFESFLMLGMDRKTAARLVVFLPMAYCYQMLPQVPFPGTFQLRLADGRISEERQLSSEPLWREATEFARTESKYGLSKNDILLVAGRSAEFNAINQLLNRGSKLEDIRLTCPLFVWLEDGPDRGEPKRRPFWRKKLARIFSVQRNPIGRVKSKQRQGKLAKTS
jgi:hypothetical protein